MDKLEPQWVVWAREIQALAQSGLTFSIDAFDRERFERLRHLSAEIFAAHSDLPQEKIVEIFASQSGYPTPKVDVRGAVFDGDGRILMVRETADKGRWTLPGGWADVTHTPAENVVKEVREESGYEVAVEKLAAVWDRARQAHPVGAFSCCKMFFVCRLVGGYPATSLETSEVRWFPENDLPRDLSTSRVLPHQLHRMFEHYRHEGLPTDFD